MRIWAIIFLLTLYYINNSYAQQIFFEDVTKINAFIRPHQYVDLGMAGVPVLDQGVNHYCSFFAAAAVLDAIIVERKGLQFSEGKDYIDHMCLISSGISGIEAANSGLLIQQGQCRNPDSPHPDVSDWRYSKLNLLIYHVTEYQRTFPLLVTPEGLANLAAAYPVTGAGQLRGLGEYSLNDPSGNILKTLENIKNELMNGHRVLFYTALLYVTAHEKQDDSDSGKDYGLFHLNLNERDAGLSLYSCTEPASAIDNCKIYQEIQANDHMHTGIGKKIGPNQYIHIAAHEMVFTAYDADAKIFKIRNSHGASRGDSGNFYMTEDYASKMLWGGSVIK
jgi:hypothetical protein